MMRIKHMFYLNENENYLNSKVYKNICVPMGAMWPSTNNTQRNSRGHNLQTKGQIRAW